MTLTIKALKAQTVWCCWKYEDRTNSKGETKRTKPPYVGRGKYGKADDPSGWLSHAEAVQLRDSAGFNGIGFFFPVSIDSRVSLFGIDIDAHDGGTNPEADAILDLFGKTYAEISPSGAGYHVIGLADMTQIPEYNTDDFAQHITPTPGNDIECYIGGYTNKYFTFPDGGTVNAEDITDCTPELKTFLHQYMKRATPGTADEQTKKTNRALGWDDEINDGPKVKDWNSKRQDTIEDRLDIARNATDGDKFALLYDTDRVDFGPSDWSASEYDLSLCALLAFYLDGDPAKIEAAFRASARYRREKYDKNRSALKKTIANAIKQCAGKYYDPQYTRSPLDVFTPIEDVPPAEDEEKNRAERQSRLWINTEEGTLVPVSLVRYGLTTETERETALLDKEPIFSDKGDDGLYYTAKWIYATLRGQSISATHLDSVAFADRAIAVWCLSYDSRTTQIYTGEKDSRKSLRREVLKTLIANAVNRFHVKGQAQAIREAEDQIVTRLVARDKTYTLQPADLTTAVYREAPYLLYPYLPAANVVLFPGKQGTGKSTMLLSLCATATAGGTVGGDCKFPEPLDVLYFTRENTIEHIIAIIKAKGGDPRRFHAYAPSNSGQIENCPIAPYGDDVYEEQIKKYRARIVVWDTFQTYAPTGVNIGDMNQAQSLMNWFQDIASRYGCTVCLVQHFTKGADDRAAMMDRSVGSVAIVGAARVQISTVNDYRPGKNPARDKLCIFTKNNLSSPDEQLTLPFAIETAPGTRRADGHGGVGYAEFGEPIKYTEAQYNKDKRRSDDMANGKYRDPGQLKDGSMFELKTDPVAQLINRIIFENQIPPALFLTYKQIEYLLSVYDGTYMTPDSIHERAEHAGKTFVDYGYSILCVTDSCRPRSSIKYKGNQITPDILPAKTGKGIRIEKSNKKTKDDIGKLFEQSSMEL